jgi:hypothetical protein
MRDVLRRLKHLFALFGSACALLGLAVVAQGTPAGAATKDTGISATSEHALARTAWPVNTELPHNRVATPQTEPAHWVSSYGPESSGTVQSSLQSTNWAGLVDTGTQFTAVKGQWTVPSVQTSQSSQYSSTWIGIDGATNTSLIQTGTSQETVNGSTLYYAWYEILPAASIPIGLVSPGDQMQASIVEDSPGTWTLSIADVSSGAVASGQLNYAGPGTSAEWIEEAPELNGQQTTLADFGSAQFTDIGGSYVNPGGIVVNTVDMVDAGGDVVASTGPIGVTSFTITYVGPVPTSPPPSTPPSKATTTTSASVNPVSTTFGKSVTYSATVSAGGGTPTGNVTFADGSTTLCTTGNLQGGSGSCAATNAPVGTDTITATYSGDSTFNGSSGSATLVVTAAPTSPPPPSTPTTPTTSPTTNSGYWLVGSDGGIFSFGSAHFYGSTGAMRLQRPVVGITPTTDNGGYWLVASDGGIFSFGDAGYYGSVPGLGIAPAGSSSPKTLNAPIVGMVPSADGRGYFMVAADGGVFTFGDARFEGSCPGLGGCSGAAVAVMPDASGNGYWLATATGHVYAFGDATYYGAPGPQGVMVTSAVRTGDGKGYWLLFSNGVVAPYGDATNLGGPPATSVGGANPASTIFTTADGNGYWVASANGSVFTFGDASNDGSMAGQHLNGSIIAAAGW